MDVKRVILIAALALVTYLLVMQWNKDYGPEHQQQVAAENAPTANSDGDLPAAGNDSQPAAAADLPTNVDSQPKATQKAANSQLITVKTDVLELKIDPHGGDIVESSILTQESNLNSAQPFELLENDSSRTYIAQSGLIGPNGTDSAAGRPLFKSAKAHYELGNKDSLNVDLVLQQSDGVTITKRFALHKGDYRLKVEYIIDNKSAQPWKGALFGQLKRDNSADPSQQTSMSMKSYMGAVFSTQQDNYQKVKFGDLDDNSNFNANSDRGWAAIVQHYFVSAWVPEPGQNYHFSARKSGGNYIVGFTAPTVTVAPGASKTIDATLYTGPKEQDQLQATAPNLKLTVDYGILWWIAYPLYLVMKFIHSLVGNWGLSIIGVTIVVKLALFQLNAKAFKSMAKMRKFAPLMAQLKEQYGDDRQRLSQEMMKLYKKEKINPLGGCLPIVVQMPVFISLYWVLKESIELRHAPFFGYIQDLSQMDPYFILPILMGVSMFVQQHLNPAPPDPTQAKIMKMLPIIFTFFFLWFPAGLVLYWVSNNCLSIAQQWIINRQIEKADQKEKPAS